MCPAPTLWNIFVMNIRILNFDYFKSHIYIYIYTYIYIYITEPLLVLCG